MLAKSLSKLIDLKFFFLELAWYEILLLEGTELPSSEYVTFELSHTLCLSTLGEISGLTSGSSVRRKV